MKTNDAVHWFYNDLHPDEAAIWDSMLKPQSSSVILTGRSVGKPWEKIPVLYIYTEKDNSVPAELQDKSIRMMKDDGAVVEVESLPSSHSPFLSMPEKLLFAINKHLI